MIQPGRASVHLGMTKASFLYLPLSFLSSLPIACNKACLKCTGAGSEKCTECSPGYENTEKGCEGENET